MDGASVLKWIAGLSLAVGIVMFPVAIASTLIATWFKHEKVDSFLDLTRALLGWPVIAGGLVGLAGVQFKEQVGELIRKFAK